MTTIEKDIQRLVEIERAEKARQAMLRKQVENGGKIYDYVLDKWINCDGK